MYTCAICNKVFPDAREFSKHLTEEHLKELLADCNSEDVIKYNHKIKTLKCKTTIKKYRFKLYAIAKKIYYDLYIKNNVNDGVCENCGKPTTFLSITRGYNRYCSRACRNLSNQFRKEVYDRRRHDDLWQYQCEYCSQRFKTKKELHFHIELVHPIDHKKDIENNCPNCRVCGSPTKKKLDGTYSEFCNKHLFYENCFVELDYD